MLLTPPQGTAVKKNGVENCHKQKWAEKEKSSKP
jgi:hypothetical protein